MSKTFSVLCPNGRKESVKVLPNNSYLQILETACKKQNLDPEKFDLCHQRKPLDLSLPVRFSNLPNNALLELTLATSQRVEGNVTICLQLESGERLVKDFTPSTALSDVVKECLSTSTESQGTEKGDPICIYMRQRISGDAIQSTTLKSLGLTQGTAILRLLYRDPENLQDQAHASNPVIRVPFNNSPPLRADSPIHMPMKQPRIELSTHQTTPSAVETQSIAEDNSQSVNGTGRMDVDNNVIVASPSVPEQVLEHVGQEDMKEEEMGDIHYIGERHAIIYNLEDITDVKKADLPDEFFELTVNDVKYLMEEYKKERLQAENQPLLLNSQRQNKFLQTLAQYKQTIVRIYFPEKLVIQAVFSIDEKVEAVLDFVRGFLNDKSLDFYLFTTPPKKVIDSGNTLLEAMLVPAANVHFGSKLQHNNVLHEDLRSKLSDPRAAAIAASQSRSESLQAFLSEDPSTSAAQTLTLTETDRAPPVDYPIVQRLPRSVQPKWLRLSK